MVNVFLCYRRGDSAGHAGRLYDGLRSEFGQSSVFMDVDTIPPGVDFVDRVQSAVTSCDVLLVLIGHEWLTIKDEFGRRRLDNEADFIRLELEAALTQDVAVIPVLVEGAPMPRSEDLPQSIAMLARRNAIELSDGRWQYDVLQLVKAIKRVVREREAKNPLRWASSRIRELPFAVKMGAALSAAIVALAIAFAGGLFEGSSSNPVEVSDVSEPKSKNPKERNRKRQGKGRDRASSRTPPATGRQPRKTSNRRKAGGSSTRNRPRRRKQPVTEAFRSYSSPSEAYTASLPAGEGWSAPRETIVTGQIYRTVSQGPGSFELQVDYAKDEQFPARENVRCDDVKAFSAFEIVQRCVVREGSLCETTACVEYLLNVSSTGPWFRVFAGGATFDTNDKLAGSVAKSLEPA